jgi:hypothetical protein
MASRPNKFGKIVGGRTGDSSAPPGQRRPEASDWNAKIGSLKHGKLGGKIAKRSAPTARKRKTLATPQPRTHPLPAPSGSSGCYIATAACGPESPEVLWLRLYRDEVLLQTIAGRLFLRL